MKTKLLSLIIPILFLLQLLPGAGASTLGLNVSPIMVEKMLQPQEQLVEYVTLTNTSNTPVVVYTSLRDFTSNDNSGAASYVRVGEKDAGATLSSWIQVAPTVVLQPNEAKKIPFTIAIPQGASPGGHYATIFFQPRPEQRASEGGATASLQTNALIGMHVLVTVGGDVVKNVELASFSIPEKTGMTDKGVVFETIFRNSGNVHVTPKGRIEIYDKDGTRLSHIGTLPQQDTKGNVYKETPVDFLPLNQKASKVLPNQVRTLQDEWKFSEKFLPEGTFTARVVWENPLTGEEVTSEVKELHMVRDISITNLQLQDQEKSTLPLSFTADIENTGTLQLHPKMTLRVRSLFGEVIAEEDIPFEGALYPGQTRPVQGVWSKGSLPFPGVYVDLLVKDGGDHSLEVASMYISLIRPVYFWLLVVMLGTLILVCIRRRLRKRGLSLQKKTTSLATASRSVRSKMTSSKTPVKKRAKKPSA